MHLDFPSLQMRTLELLKTYSMQEDRDGPCPVKYIHSSFALCVLAVTQANSNGSTTESCTAASNEKEAWLLNNLVGRNFH